MAAFERKSEPFVKSEMCTRHLTRQNNERYE